ncbi:MAB_1171c family putative transporter [Kitasatospora purpeofusca]|uniref:DUF6545 domain-containing protein n=1 Tax=Kitasatospora purpeofusca TaxID=67352 RepID=A0ABZ1U1B4_9ACTN|nr:MAB_1171c family putative transporter [Kitasatospora purpeofusca]
MRPLFSVLMPALLWLVTLWRAPQALRSPASRALWATAATMAVSLSTRPPAVARFMEDVSGVPEISVLVKHVLGIASATFLLDYVHAIHGRPGQAVPSARRRHGLAVLAALTLTVLFVFFLKHDSTAAPDSIDAYYGEPAVRIYLAVDYLFLGVATALAAHLFWSNRLNVPPGLLRTGVRLLAAGSATGFLYTVYRVVFVSRQGNAPVDPATGRPVPVTDFLCELLPAVAVVLMVAGVTMPPLQVALRHLRDRSAMWRLHPLWADLVGAVPHVVFGTPHGRFRELLTYGDRSLDLAHRAFEIRDAALALRDELPEAPAARPGPDLPGPDLLVDAAPARGEALWLRAALHHRTHGSPPTCGMPPRPDHPGGCTPHEEIARLLEVAAAYRHLDGRAAEPAARA